MNSKNLIIFAPLIGGGGVEKNLFIITNDLAHSFKNIKLITASLNQKNKFNSKIKIIHSNLKFLNNINNRHFKIFLCLVLLLKYYFLNFKQQNTVISFHGNLYCCVLSKILGFKVIIRSNASITGWSKNFIKKYLYKLILKLADCIIVNSKEFQREYKIKFNLKTLCIYNPLDKANIIKKSKKKINFNFFKNKTINFINVGRLVPQKDQLTLIKAFNLLKQKTNIRFRLLIMGKGSEKYKLIKLIKKYQLNKNIKLLDFKKNPYPFIKKSDVFVLSSVFEGLPNVLLESIVLKKFVISSNCPTGPKEILDNGRGGHIFQMKNPYDLYLKINNYLNNKNKLKKKIIHSNKRLFRFDYRRNLNKYHNILKII